MELNNNDKKYKNSRTVKKYMISIAYVILYYVLIYFTRTVYKNIIPPDSLLFYTVLKYIIVYFIIWLIGLIFARVLTDYLWPVGESVGFKHAKNGKGINFTINVNSVVFPMQCCNCLKSVTELEKRYFIKFSGQYPLPTLSGEKRAYREFNVTVPFCKECFIKVNSINHDKIKKDILVSLFVTLFMPFIGILSFDIMFHLPVIINLIAIGIIEMVLIKSYPNPESDSLTIDLSDTFYGSTAKGVILRGVGINADRKYLEGFCHIIIKNEKYANIFEFINEIKHSAKKHVDI